MTNSPAGELPMLEQRRIEARILKHVYDTLKASHGLETAQQTIGEAVRAASVEQAQMMAAEVGGNTSMATFVKRSELWEAGGALTIAVQEKTSERYRFNVTQCAYSKMYREMGLGEIGHLLSCQRDGTFSEGYDARLKLKRTQTIMQGASHCDFDYRLQDDDTPA